MKTLRRILFIGLHRNDRMLATEPNTFNIHAYCLVKSIHRCIDHVFVLVFEEDASVVELRDYSSATM